MSSCTVTQTQSPISNNMGQRTDVLKMNDDIDLDAIISVFRSSALLRIAYGVGMYDGPDREYNLQELVEQFDIGRSSMERQLETAVSLSLLIEVDTDGYPLYRINTESAVADTIVVAMMAIDERMDDENECNKK